MLAALCARARAANPELAIDDEVFVARLARSGTSPSAVCVEDLHLACACLEKVPGAAAELRRRHGAAVRAAIARIVPPSQVGEVEQRLLEKLLVGKVDSPPKIGSYAGQAPLANWLQVSAQREALMSLRSDRAELRARAKVAEGDGLADVPHPEIAYLKERYRGHFEDALQQTLRDLAQRDRALLRLHLVSGLSETAIAKMYSVTQSTVSRWLSQARRTLLDGITDRLRTQLGVSSNEVASLAGLMASGLDLSLSQLLKTS